MPGVIAGLWKAMALVGLDRGPWLAGGARLLVVALSGAGAWSAMALAGRRGGRLAAALAGGLCLAHPLVLLTSYRTMGESVSASIVLCAAALVDLRGDITPRRAALAGLVCGLGVFVRFQEGLVVLILGAQLAAARRWRELVWYGAAAALAGAAGGLLDAFTWGAPFHSFATYFEFNFIEDGAKFYGIAPWWQYLAWMWAVSGPAAALLLVAFVAGARRAPWLATLAGLYFLAHSLTAHKELRFLVTALPAGLVVAALGLAELPRRAAIAAGALLVAALAWRVPRMSYEEAGEHTPRSLAPNDAMLFSERELNPAIAWVGRQPDVCGVMVPQRDIIWTGGHVWLHRDVPLVFVDRAVTRRGTNYFLSADGAPRDAKQYERVGKVGRYGIYRRPGTCAPIRDPGLVSLRPTETEIETAKDQAEERLDP